MRLPGIRLVLWILFVWNFAALAHCQVISIDAGTPTDGCIGGTAWSQPDMGAGVLSTLRYGSRFSCRASAPSGAYLVRFFFVEPNATAALQRLFKVQVNGQESDVLDVFASVGARPAGLMVETTALSYFGTIKIDFVAVRGNAIVNAIEIQPLTSQSTGQVVAKSYECLRGTGVGATAAGAVASLDQTNCLGLRAATFRKPDGSETVPYILVPLPAIPLIELQLQNGEMWRIASIP